MEKISQSLSKYSRSVNAIRLWSIVMPGRGGKNNYFYSIFQAKMYGDMFSFQVHSFFQIYIYLYDLNCTNF